MARPLTAFGLSRRFRLPPLARGPELLERVRATRERFSLELAWDGHRVLCTKVGAEVRIVSDDLRDWAESFPTLARALAKLAAKSLVLEAWICALDSDLRPSFALLKTHLESKAPARVVLAIADVLHVDGEDLRSLPIAERRARLAALLAGKGAPLTLSGTLPGTIDEVLSAARALGLSAVLARSNEGAPIVLPCADEATEKKKLSPKPTVTNATKVLYPRDGYTKQDVVDYYASIADVMLPHLRDRPVVCQRWPDGIDAFTWYQHRIPPKAPDYLRAVTIEGNRRIVVDDREGLLWLANQAALTFHGWASRVDALDQPDWVVLDLDPGASTTWAQTIEVALAVRKLLELLDLPSVPKTSGQKGLHVLVPIARGHEPMQAHLFAERVAKLIAKTLPSLVTLEQSKEKRGGRLYLDHLQSFVGKSLVLPYSLRAADRAPASTPLDWSEVTEKLDPKTFHLRTMRARLDAVGDRARPLLEGRAKLAQALARLPD